MKTGCTVIFDIDGTLANCEHRRHLVDLSVMNDGEEAVNGLIASKNWPEFKRRASFDPTYPDIKRLLDQLRPLNHIVLCTGRDTTQEEQTRKWLFDNNISYSALYMRGANDYRSDAIVKKELYVQMLEDGYTPWLVVDDRDSVVKLWRDLGLTCLQCRPGDF